MFAKNLIALKIVTKTPSKQSAACYSLFNSVKNYFENQRKMKDDAFQSWSEFENRGFRKPEYMESWFIEEYGVPKDVLKMDTVNVNYEKFKSYDAGHTHLRQTVKNPMEILVKVHAASINPIDIRMCQGYGRRLLNRRRSILLDFLNQFFTVSDHTEFPLVLGRDFSGTVVDVGAGVFDFLPGDEVYGTQELHKQGTLADYTCVHMKCLAIKPATLSHVEAAALPYVASTTLSALSGLLEKGTGKRALLLGGSGGVGTFSIQLLKAHGYHVSVTCSAKNQSFCTNLGADFCYDYHSDTVEDEIKDDARFDIVFDTVGAVNSKWAVDVLNRNGTYVTLISPLLKYTDDLGILLGLSSAGSNYVQTKMQTKGINVKWGFYSPSRDGLRNVAKLVDAGSIKPVIQDIFDFKSAVSGFEKVESGHTRGKIVINVSGLPEASCRPNVDRIIHL